jgi:hypothetical protein
MKTAIFLFCYSIIFLLNTVHAQQISSRFRILALYENKGHHVAYGKAAIIWLNKLAADSSFTIDYIQNTDSIDEHRLSKYQLFYTA